MRWRALLLLLLWPLFFFGGEGGWVGMGISCGGFCMVVGAWLFCLRPAVGNGPATTTQPPACQIYPNQNWRFP